MYSQLFFDYTISIYITLFPISDCDYCVLAFMFMCLQYPSTSPMVLLDVCEPQINPEEACDKVDILEWLFGH